MKALSYHGPASPRDRKASQDRSWLPEATLGSGTCPAGTGPPPSVHCPPLAGTGLSTGLRVTGELREEPWAGVGNPGPSLSSAVTGIGPRRGRDPSPALVSLCHRCRTELGELHSPYSTDDYGPGWNQVFIRSAMGILRRESGECFLEKVVLELKSVPQKTPQSWAAWECFRSTLFPAAPAQGAVAHQLPSWRCLPSAPPPLPPKPPLAGPSETVTAPPPWG